ncbi:MAG: FtsX-like permease family protein [Mucilaginibacter sp.]|uniref:ABC transporter permease n=1 Tax=Mucilaginibacter sp. TaxID=1882438 RepID=UPI0034E52156
MIKNYFRLTFRNLLKNKVSSIINIGGLAVGLATGIIIMLEIVNEVSYDKFNINLADTYLLMSNQNMNGDIKTGNTTPGLLATSVLSEIPEIKYAARTCQQSDLIRNGDKTIYTNSIYTDADFFKIMTFPALKGNAVNALKQPNTVVLTETTAKKIFGTTDVIGKLLMLNNTDAVNIAAVIRDVPQNSTNQFDMAIPFMLFESKNEWLKKWDDSRIQTWIQVKPNVKLTNLNKKLKDLFLRKQLEKNIDLFAYPFSALRLHDQFKNGKPSGGVIDIIMLLSTIAGFVLLIACINFMNLATARSEQRAREVGVRKVLGASRKRIIIQFLGEALVLSFLALLLGILLAVLALPAFLQLSGKNFTPDFANWQLWLLLIVLGITTGLVAGSYPAFYLSSFKPIQVLKKMMNRDKGGSLFRKSLVTFQFVISIFLIIATIVISKQIDYLQQRPVGYDADNLMDIHASTDLTKKFSIVKNELLQIPGVKNVSAGTDNLVRMGGAFNGLDWPGKTPDQDFYITTTKVGYDWVKTAGFQLAAGRDFNPAYGTDTAACLINQAAAQRMGLKEPVVGTKLGSTKVIGVIKDFVFNHPFASPEPMVVYLGKSNMNHFFVRLNNDEKWREGIAQIEKVVKKTSPDFPFEFEFTKEEYQKNFKEFDSLRQMSNLFSGMAIFISCLGLFGLSAFLAERRSKEISIRKVLGASAGSLWLTLSKDFLKPVFLAFIIAAPLTGLAMQKVLGYIDYHIQLSWWMFAIAALAATVIAIVAISYNGIKAALANPVKSLRSE